MNTAISLAEFVLIWLLRFRLLKLKELNQTVSMNLNLVKTGLNL